MSKLRERTTATLLIAIFMISTFTVTIASASYEDSITSAADRLVSLQNEDGGWTWIVGSSAPSAPNTFGVTALGLIDAYRITSDSSYFDAAKKTADYLKSLDRSSDSSVRIQSFDYRFLVKFSAISGDPSYGAHAISQWNWVKTNVATYYADGNQAYLYTFWSGPGYAIWSASDFVLATLAMGDTSWAEAMAVVVDTNLGTITSADDCRFIGWGHALEALNAVSTDYITEINLIITLLEASQEVDGYWLSGQAEGIAQDTAYASMGLAVVGRKDSAKKAIDWLVANQDDLGGWVEEGEEITETDSEALQALCYVAARARFVPGKGKGLDKGIPNDNFAQGRQ